MNQNKKQEIGEIEAIFFDIEQNSTALCPTGFIVDSEDKAT